MRWPGIRNQIARARWESHFCWLPVVIDGDEVWLELVDRKLVARRRTLTGYRNVYEYRYIL